MKQSLFEQQLTHPCDEGAMTVSISRRVKQGHEAQFERWISGVIEAASTYPGHLGANVLRPRPTTNHEYVSIYRFDSYSNCQKWEKSALRQQWLAKLDPMVEGDPVTLRGTGLEFWFDLPELPVQKHPPTHKMALVLISVLYTLVLTFNLALAPWIEGMPLWLRVLVFIVLQVLLMSYIIMPRVTRLLRPWLYK